MGRLAQREKDLNNKEFNLSKEKVWFSKAIVLRSLQNSNIYVLLFSFYYYLISIYKIWWCN